MRRTVYLAVGECGDEYVFTLRPVRSEAFFRTQRKAGYLGVWEPASSTCKQRSLFNGTIELLIGRKLTWADEPVEIELEVKNDLF